MLFESALLLVLLATYAVARVGRWAARVLRLDVWEMLVYLGLAELEAPAPAARRERLPRLRS